MRTKHIKSIILVYCYWHYQIFYWHYLRGCLLVVFPNCPLARNKMMCFRFANGGENRINNRITIHCYIFFTPIFKTKRFHCAIFSHPHFLINALVGLFSLLRSWAPFVAQQCLIVIGFVNTNHFVDVYNI